MFRKIFLGFLAFGFAMVLIGKLSGLSSPSAAAPQTQEQALQKWAAFSKMYVKANVLERLKDPSSAVFKELWVHRPSSLAERKDPIVCGEVNARNGFGGYTGMKGFVSYRNKLYIEPHTNFYTYWNRYCVSKQGRTFL